MSRKKWYLQAPDNGTGEAVIEGSYYWPEMGENGIYTIEVTNQHHMEVLVNQHHFQVIGEIEQLPPPTAFGPIDVEELGRSGLEQALVERGVTWDRSDGRAGMEAAALAWNEARKGRVRSEQSAPAMRPVVNTDSPEFQAAVMEAVRAALAEHSQAPQSQQPVIDLEKAYPGQTAPQIIIDDPRVGDGPRTAEVATLDTVDATLIPSMDMASLKALLKASDVVFNEKALPHTLRKIALDEVEQRQRAA